MSLTAEHIRVLKELATATQIVALDSSAYELDEEFREDFRELQQNALTITFENERNQ